MSDENAAQSEESLIIGQILTDNLREALHASEAYYGLGFAAAFAVYAINNLSPAGGVHISFFFLNVDTAKPLIAVLGIVSWMLGDLCSDALKKSREILWALRQRSPVMHGAACLSYAFFLRKTITKVFYALAPGMLLLATFITAKTHFLTTLWAGSWIAKVVAIFICMSVALPYLNVTLQLAPLAECAKSNEAKR